MEWVDTDNWFPPYCSFPQSQVAYTGYVKNHWLSCTSCIAIPSETWRDSLLLISNWLPTLLPSRLPVLPDRESFSAEWALLPPQSSPAVLPCTETFDTAAAATAWWTQPHSWNQRSRESHQPAWFPSEDKKERNSRQENPYRCSAMFHYQNSRDKTHIDRCRSQTPPVLRCLSELTRCERIVNNWTPQGAK